MDRTPVVLDRTPQRSSIDGYPEKHGLLLAAVVGPAALFTTRVIVPCHGFGVLGRLLALWALLLVCSSRVDLFGDGLTDDLVECLAIHIATRSLHLEIEGTTTNPVLGLRRQCRRRPNSSGRSAAHSAISVGVWLPTSIAAAHTSKIAASL
jgi:hypothetical protein